jgi:hypothetical protein
MALSLLEDAVCGKSCRSFDKVWMLHAAQECQAGFSGQVFGVTVSNSKSNMQGWGVRKGEGNDVHASL